MLLARDFAQSPLSIVICDRNDAERAIFIILDQFTLRVSFLIIDKLLRANLLGT